MTRFSKMHRPTTRRTAIVKVALQAIGNRMRQAFVIEVPYIVHLDWPRVSILIIKRMISLSRCWPLSLTLSKGNIHPKLILSKMFAEYSGMSSSLRLDGSAGLGLRKGNSMGNDLAG